MLSSSPSSSSSSSASSSILTFEITQPIHISSQQSNKETISILSSSYHPSSNLSSSSSLSSNNMDDSSSFFTQDAASALTSLSTFRSSNNSNDTTAKNSINDSTSTILSGPSNTTIPPPPHFNTFNIAAQFGYNHRNTIHPPQPSTLPQSFIPPSSANHYLSSSLHQTTTPSDASSFSLLPQQSHNTGKPTFDINKLSREIMAGKNGIILSESDAQKYPSREARWNHLVKRGGGLGTAHSNGRYCTIKTKHTFFLSFIVLTLFSLLVAG